jgi:predicted dehydrogenase
MWLGPMRWRPHNKSYYHGSFRQIMDSGGGQIRDRGAHVFSLIRWCLNIDELQPVSVEAAGTPPRSGIFDCPVQMRAVYTFRDPDLEVVWEQPGERYTNYPEKNKDFGLVFWGEKDNLVVDRDGTRYEAAPKARRFEAPPGGVDPQHIERFDDYNMNHKQDWFEAIRTGRKPIMDIRAGHNAALMCILANLSYLLGRKLNWDGRRQRFTGDEYANRMLATPQRYPYAL